MEGEEGQFGGDIAGRDLLMKVTAGHKGERLCRVELDKQHGATIKSTHREALGVETPTLQGTNEVTDTFALYADLRSQYVVANL